VVADPEHRREVPQRCFTRGEATLTHQSIRGGVPGPVVPGPVTRQGAVESDHDEPKDDQPGSGRTEDVDDEYTPVPGRRGPVIGAHVIAGRRAWSAT
jgi:hypothetical protein